MKTGLWLSQRQVRWLIVLLAILPLLPTALLVQVMRQSARGDRDEAASELSEMYQAQLVHLSERFSVLNPRAAEGELEEYLQQVFGKEIPLRVIDLAGGAELVDWPPGAVLHEITGGRFRGWTVAIVDVPRFRPHLAEQKTETVWNTVAICVGVITVAAVAWYAVHRRLRIDELRGDLLAIVSHEMKTPIAASRVLLDTLESGALDKAAASEYLAMVGRENERLAELTEQFLTFSRLERGQVRLEEREFRLDRLIEEQIGLIAPRFEAVGGRLDWRGGDEVRIRTDPQAVKVVLSNLFANVLKHGGKPPRGEVRASCRGERILVRVRDWGEGVPPADRRTVFRPYYRRDAELSERGRGSGLGLAISRRFTGLLRGGLRFVDGEGPGACLELWLPRGEEGRAG